MTCYNRLRLISLCVLAKFASFALSSCIITMVKLKVSICVSWTCIFLVLCVFRAKLTIVPTNA